MNKLVLLKTGWCDQYDGDSVVGNYGHVKKHGEKSGHERFNFLRRKAGWFRGYCPPIGKSYATPNPPIPDGWTVVWISKKPGTKGVRIVGAYFDAVFNAGKDDVGDEEINYCVSAKSGFLVPPELRTENFKSPIKSGPCFYLIGGDKDRDRRKLAKYVMGELQRLQGAIGSSPELQYERIAFPDIEHIRRVEKAAVQFVWKKYERDGFKVKSREKDPVGYDLDAVKGKEKLKLEVKGTSSDISYAFITRKELGVCRGNPDAWVLCMVTNALTSPKLKTFGAREFEQKFELAPLAYRATMKM